MEPTWKGKIRCSHDRSVTSFVIAQLLTMFRLRSPRYKSRVHLYEDKPLCFLQVNGNEKQHQSGSYQNQDEADAVVQLIKQIRESSLRYASNSKWYDAERLRVITFYQAQATLIRNLCYKAFAKQPVFVGTVDANQGCEADIVIVSFVRGNSVGQTNYVNQAGFLTDNRRMNVALTRAKYQLICVGNATGLAALSGKAEQTLKLLANHAKHHHRVFPFEPATQSQHSAADFPDSKRPRWS